MMFAALAAVTVAMAVRAEGEPKWAGLLPERIGARSGVCDKSFVKDGKIADYVCDDRLNTVLEFLKLDDKVKLGPCSTLCKVYSCALLALGCGEEYQAVTDTIITGCESETSNHCENLAALDAETCANAAEYLAPAAGAPALPDIGAIGDAGFFDNEFLPWVKTQVALCNNPATLLSVINLVGDNVQLFGADVSNLVNSTQTPCGVVCESGACLLDLVGCDVEATRVKNYRNVEAQQVCPTEDALDCEGTDECAEQYRPMATKCNALQNCPPADTPWHVPSFPANADSTQLQLVQRCCPTECADRCAAAGATCAVDAVTGAGGPNGEAALAITAGDASALAAARTTCQATTGGSGKWDLACNPLTSCYFCKDQCDAPCAPTPTTCAAGSVVAKNEAGCCDVCLTCGVVQVLGRCPAAPTSCPDGQMLVNACTGDACTTEASCCTRCVANDGTEIDNSTGGAPAAATVSSASHVASSAAGAAAATAVAAAMAVVA